MDWPTAAIILGIIGTVIVAIIKFAPVRDRRDNSHIDDLRKEVGLMMVEFKSDIKTLSARIDNLILEIKR